MALAKVKTVTSAGPCPLQRPGRGRNGRAGRVDIIDQNDPLAEQRPSCRSRSPRRRRAHCPRAAPGAEPDLLRGALCRGAASSASKGLPDSRGQSPGQARPTG